MKLKIFSDNSKFILGENIVLKRMLIKAHLFIKDTFS